MPQNIYDNESFFAGYRQLRDNDAGLNGAIEIPAIRRLLPPLEGFAVLDLGCGFGEFARYARQCGAASVTAVDISHRMLAEARQRTNDTAIRYLCAAIEDYAPPPHSFDLAVSSLALHYVADLADVARRVFKALKPSGRLVLSVEHPICTANPIGWMRDASGNASHWPLDRYQDEGKRDTSWFVNGVTKHHRTVATYVNTLLDAGFQILRCCEPAPLPEALAARPQLALDLRRPPLLVLSAEHPRPRNSAAARSAFGR